MEGTATKRRLRWRLKADAFERLLKAYRGDMAEAQIAEIFEMGPDNWSQVKNGHRYMGTHILAVCSELFPGVLVTEYAEVVRFEPPQEGR